MKKIFILTISILLVTGCGKDFLDRKPLSDVAVSNYYKTPADANEAILAVYSVLQGQRFYGTAYMKVTEYPSDDATSKLPAEVLDNFNWSAGKGLGGEGSFKDIWVSIYEGVYRANLVLQNVPNIAMNAAEKKVIIAEAYMFRGIYYWYLATLFGGGPMFDKPAEKIEEVTAERKSRAEVYAQCVKDMETAIPDLPESWDASRTGRLTKTAGQAFLGKAYLYFACYDKANAPAHFGKAKDYLRAVVASGRYKLLPKFTSVFTEDNENNTETVFEVQYKNRGTAYSGWYSDGGNANEGQQRDLLFGIQNQPTQAGFGEIIATQNWVSSLEIGDPRVRQTVYFLYDSSLTGYESGSYDKYSKVITYQPSWSTLVKATGNVTGQYYHVKKAVSGYIGSAGPIVSGNNFRVIRYADVLLMLAEAINETDGPTAEAIKYLNLIRERAKKSTPYTYGVTNSVDKTNPSYVQTVSGSSLLKPFPYFTTNSAQYNDFTGEDSGDPTYDFRDGLQPSLQQAIVLERRAELAFEYHRFLDMLRWEAYSPSHPGAATNIFNKKPVLEDKQPYIYGKHNLFPIPQTEIDLSKGTVKQNPGY